MIGTTDNRVTEPETEVTDEDRRFVLENINKRVNLKQPLEEKDILSERAGGFVRWCWKPIKSI